jgi:hypothetical protein
MFESGRFRILEALTAQETAILSPKFRIGKLTLDL